MKRIIKWLAEQTGVAQNIRKESYIEVGNRMQQYSYWFTGGFMVKGHKYDISNILYQYPEMCLKRGTPSLYANQFQELRQKLWELSDENKSIIVENNKQK